MTLSTVSHPNRETALKIFVPSVALLVLAVWLINTPAGLLGKADAIAYAICHRIAARSFYLGDRQMPLCARCTGMYLGTLAGFLFQYKHAKRGGMPVLKIMILLGIILVAFGIDGVNSYLHLIPNAPSLYTPENWLRLLTGTALGIGIAAVLLPVFNQTVWTDWTDRPILHSWKQVALLVIIAGILDLTVLSGNPILLYPLALLGSATVMLILGMIYTVIWLMLFKQENKYHHLKEVWLPLTAGFTTALIQISIMDWGRYALTGTWKGFFSS
ncbi:MAG: DUF2085 domain-containing protein [Anaerolineaceae bacterium]|nr:DUF2085 domain-containing protein [Anaerolineaceae bacterium]